MGICAYAMACIGKSGGNLWELALSLYHMGLRDQTQMVRLGDKHLSCCFILLTLDLRSNEAQQ